MGAPGADVGNTGLGGTARWGVEAKVGVGVNGGGGGVGGVSTSKNRPPHHKYKYKSPKQFITFLRTKTLKRQTKNRSSEKSHK